LNGTAEPAAPGQGALGLLEQAAARAALRGLPGRQREAIVLRYYAGLPEGQIAAATGLSRGVVNSTPPAGCPRFAQLPARSARTLPDPRDSDDAGSRHQ
jgi:DNA-directed RNA polymerase specialized sigma24 family protein